MTRRFDANTFRYNISIIEIKPKKKYKDIAVDLREYINNQGLQPKASLSDIYLLIDCFINGNYQVIYSTKLYNKYSRELDIYPFKNLIR